MRRADPHPRTAAARPRPRAFHAFGGGSPLRPLQLASWAVLVTLLAGFGLWLPLYWVFLLQTVAIGALVARGLGLLVGRVGLITLCQLSFAAVGGWVVAALALAWPGLPFPLLVLVGGCAAAPIGWLLGLATSRIRGVEFAVVTLGFAAALDLVLRQGSFPGVGSGTPVTLTAPLDDPRWFFAFCWFTAVALHLVLRAAQRSRQGLAFAAVQSGERAAAALGVRASTTKALALGIGAGFAGVAGGLWAGQYGLLTPEVFSPLGSLTALATAVLCGASLFSGAVLAGALQAFIPELLRRFGLPLDLQAALLGLGAFDVLRRGTGGIAEQGQRWLEGRVFRAVRVNCALGPLDPVAEASTPEMTEPVVDRAAVATRSDSAREPVLEVTDLSVTLGSTLVLDSVDFAVLEGEVHALIGPNGAGKSTLVDAITGFLSGPGIDPAGVVRLDGVAINGLAARERARLGVRRTFQQPHAIEALTVGEYLKLAAGVGAGVNGGGSAPRTHLAALRETFGLPDDRVPIRLIDAGSRRVLEIAAALASGPRVLLLDEPAAGQSDVESLLLAERVRRIPQWFGSAVVLIEHDLRFVRAAAHRVSVLDAGRFSVSGSPVAVLEDPLIAAVFGAGVSR